MPCPEQTEVRAQQWVDWYCQTRCNGEDKPSVDHDRHHCIQAGSYVAVIQLLIPSLVYEAEAV